MSRIRGSFVYHVFWREADTRFAETHSLNHWTISSIAGSFASASGPFSVPAQPAVQSAIPTMQSFFIADYNCAPGRSPKGTVWARTLPKLLTVCLGCREESRSAASACRAGVTVVGDGGRLLAGVGSISGWVPSLRSESSCSATDSSCSAS